jgi:preprotein translocase subunit SecE
LQNEELSKDLYKTVFTFGFTSPANINASFELIDRELRNVSWYVDNQYDDYTIAILEYATGLSLFNYALPAVIKDLFTVVFQVSEPDFFHHVKDYIPLSDQQGLPDKNMIKDVLMSIEKKYKADYPSLEMDLKKLNYSSQSKFLLSYILMIRSLNFQKSK